MPRRKPPISGAGREDRRDRSRPAIEALDGKGSGLDAIHPTPTVDLLGDCVEPEPLLQCAGEGAAHGVRLPAGGGDDLAMLAPSGRRSIAISAACLVPSRVFPRRRRCAPLSPAPAAPRPRRRRRLRRPRGRHGGAGGLGLGNTGCGVGARPVRSRGRSRPSAAMRSSTPRPSSRFRQIVLSAGSAVRVLIDGLLVNQARGRAAHRPPCRQRPRAANRAAAGGCRRASAPRR